ncbi:MAG: hypothetical protein A2934_04030 [Candidatus Sungbacteria bacterium RIFCSPLOWO2_01_FULL_47_10]|uniref:Major facilitator superfamily (MFS) profile domain-containing protein n=1 Tax=Candidatus Sungbacteria bacterium RIFCSPLOWO2_01_FULL_47_10 TaxID=1802276 RepID=A0A1G2L2Z8_9BACT|nr:MAG: hypothetical protein A2934_04030 [Candidatus Sungbacteria bacterium RIFCSPLOWO2_01_FULL_47_10]
MHMKISFNLPNMRKISFPAINQVILIMTIAEFVFAISVAFITPVFALFVVNDIKAPVAAAGFSVAVYWGIKSILQLPIARYLDKNHGEIDDFYSMIGGLFIMACVQYFYYFVGSEWQIYLLQSLMAVGNAFVTPPFLAIFSRHIDKDKEAFEWALWSSFSIGAGTAFGGFFSGILAITIGIRPIFLISGTLIFIGMVIHVFLRPYIKPKVPSDLGQFYGLKK